MLSLFGRRDDLFGMDIVHRADADNFGVRIGKQVIERLVDANVLAQERDDVVAVGLWARCVDRNDPKPVNFGEGLGMATSRDTETSNGDP